MKITGWQTDKSVTLKSQTDGGKVCLTKVRTNAGGTREKGADRHEEKVIKPGFRQAFMGSQTQTLFEAVKRFWVYESDNSDWRKTEI